MKRVEDRFADVWRERNKVQPILANEWVDNALARGRNQTLTFLIRIREEKLIQKIVEIQDKLSAVPCVDPIPEDYLHITVKRCGFLVESEMYEDDILIENRQTINSQHSTDPRKSLPENCRIHAF